MSVIGFLKDKFSSKGNEPEVEALPWEAGESIYHFIDTNIDPETGKLKADSGELPDEIPAEAGALRWAPGALDGAMGHHASLGSEKKSIKKIVNLVDSVARSDNQLSKVNLYKLLEDDEILSLIDDVLEELGKRGVPVEPYLLKFLQFLVRRSTHRGPVKFSIALLGAIQDVDSTEFIRKLGSHEEFTLYAATALANGSGDVELELWDLAKKVDGWGRIQLVERLAETQNVDIKKWILLEGYKNSVMYEYLAYIAASTGELHNALNQGFVDDKLLEAASDILQALMAGGPAEDLSCYEEAPGAIKDYLRHIEAHQSNKKLSYFLTVQYLAEYLTDLDEEDSQAWADSKSDIQNKCSEVLAWSGWLGLAAENLKSKNSYDFHIADQVAKHLGLNTWDVHWERLQDEPFEFSKWHHVMGLANIENIDQILDFADKKIPLEKVATGAAEEMGFGDEFTIHGCVETIASGLDQFSGKGLKFIEASLKSPVTRGRNMSMNALEAWGKDTVESLGAMGLVLEALKVEPDEDVRERLDAFRSGREPKWD